MSSVAQTLACLLFGRSPLISYWLLGLGTIMWLGHAFLVIAIFSSSGPIDESALTVVVMFLRAMLDYSLARPDASILLVAGLVGRQCIKRQAATTDGGVSQIQPEPPSNGLASSVFGTSFRLPLWLLIPSGWWVFSLITEIRVAYANDLPVQTYAWIGPRPQIDDFWQDVFWPSLDLSTGMLGFWCFVLSVSSAIIITLNSQSWSIERRVLISSLIASPVVVFLTALAILVPPNANNQSTPEEILKLHQAVRLGDNETVLRMIGAGVDLNARGSRNVTSLEIAIDAEDLDMARLLIEEGADIYSMTSTRTTHLVSAVYAGNKEVISLLIAVGADPNRKGEYQTAPLHPAARHGSYEIVETLLDAGAEVNIQDKDGRTPLHHAAEMGRLDIVTLLLDRGAGIEAKDERAYTPLMAAVCEPLRYFEHERIEKIEAVVNTLIDRGASVHGAVDAGSDALSCASRFGHVSIVKRMLDMGVNVDGDAVSGTAIAQTAWTEGPQALEIARMLLERGARLDIPDSHGFYPVHEAAKSGKVDLLKLFLENGANPDTRSPDGKTPLEWARYYGNDDVVELLGAYSQ